MSRKYHIRKFDASYINIKVAYNLEMSNYGFHSPIGTYPTKEAAQKVIDAIEEGRLDK